MDTKILREIAHHYGQLSALYARLAVEGHEVQPDLPATPAARTCHCGIPAKRKTGIRSKGDRIGQPYVAYACPKDRFSKCDYWQFADDEAA